MKIKNTKQINVRIYSQALHSELFELEKQAKVVHHPKRLNDLRTKALILGYKAMFKSNASEQKYINNKLSTLLIEHEITQKNLIWPF